MSCGARLPERQEKCSHPEEKVTQILLSVAARGDSAAPAQGDAF